MPKFSTEELAFFKAESGAYSVVTAREAEGDKSVTIVQDEKSVLFKCYSEDSFARAGGAKPNGNLETKKFYVIDPETREYSERDISVKYPKADKNELRLYFNRPSGFYPLSGQNWFIFTRKGERLPFIGAVDENKLDFFIKQDQDNIFEQEWELDQDDTEYQKSISSLKVQEEAREYQVTKHNRNAALGAQAIKEANYKCQIDSNHLTFISRVSGQQFMEVHHLIPVSKSDDFEYSLDVESNLIVLCPNCHRCIHYGDIDSKKKLLNRFYNERISLLNSSGIFIELAKLLRYYGI